VARIASTVLVVSLLAATTAAFALTEGLKLQESPIFRTKVDEIFSPVCDCEKAEATIRFHLRERDRVDLSIVDGDENVVRTVVRNQDEEAGRVELGWDGLDDAGEVLPEGEYKPRVHLRRERWTIVMPNEIRIDVTPPVVQAARVRPRVFSPDGDRRRDGVVIPYRLSEPARALLYVNGTKRVETLYARERDELTWAGRVDGQSVPPGPYVFNVRARDPAGNLGPAMPLPTVTVRYVALGRPRVVVLAGARFAIRVSTDARRVRWTLGARSGRARPGTLRLRAPRQQGRYTLAVSANGRTARAAVFVREPSR
jgi:FlgD Ig-like domain